jgi:Ras-related protein Rab-5C
MYYRDANAALIGIFFFNNKVFDITDNESFNKAKTWVGDLTRSSVKDAVMLLIGNKFDIVKDNPNSREIDIETAQSFADERGIGYFEVSALSGYNIDNIFRFIGDKYIEKVKKLENENNEDDEQNLIKITENEPKKIENGGSGGSCSCLLL